MNSNFTDIKTAYNAHDIATTDVHGLTSPSAIVGTEDEQTLTNKTLTSPQISFLTSSKSTDYTILDDDKIRVLLITAAANRTITLPTLADNQGRIIEIKKVDSGTGEVIVDGEGSETIDGSTTVNLSERYDTISVIGGASEWNVLEMPQIRVEDYTSVGTVGATGNKMAGYTLTADIETLIGAMISIYNLSDNTDISGNSHTLNDADAYNAGTGILGATTTAYLGVNGEHLQADAVTITSGDTSLSIAGWHKMLVSGGAVAVGTNAATQKMQYYTDANGLVVFDVAGVTSTSSSTVTGVWTHVALVYDQANSVACGYINGVCETSFQCTSNLAIQASPSVWVNCIADGTLEVASTHDEICIYEGVMVQRDIDILFSTLVPEPAAIQDKEYTLVEKIRPEGDTDFEYQEPCQVVTKYNDNIYVQGRSNGSTDTVKRLAKVGS